MPELEIHHEAGHAIDPMGQRVGVLAAILAVALAIVSISSHRTHTDAIIHKSTANDKWAQYQSTRVKYHSLELGENLLDVMGASGERANLMRANMRTSNLAGAVLRGADFFQADLVDADLSGADLKDARLSAAKLFNANETGTNFQGAIMPDNSVHP